MKEYKIKPTPKQKRFVKKLSESISRQDDKTLKAIAIDSGYSEEIAKTPSKITRSKGVLQLFKEAGITPEKVAKKMNEALDAPVKNPKMSWTEKLRAIQLSKEAVIDTSESKLAPQFQFIEKFLNIQQLKLNRPKMSGSSKRATEMRNNTD